jgi:hypothetical protein
MCGVLLFLLHVSTLTVDVGLADAASKHAFAVVVVGDLDIRGNDWVVVRADDAETRLRVLARPAVILFAPDGREVGRMEGVATGDGEGLVRRLGELKSRGDVVKDLSARAVATHDLSERASVVVELAHQRLARGDDTALSDLERAMTSDAGAKSDAAEAALFWTAAYLSRVAHDASAEHVWRELLMRFPKGPHADTARAEYVAALRARKLDDLADRVVARASKR